MRSGKESSRERRPLSRTKLTSKRSMLILRGLPLALAAVACSEGDREVEVDAMDEETTFAFGLSSALFSTSSVPSSFGLSSPSPSSSTPLSRQGALRDAEPHDADAPARGGAAGVEVEWQRRAAKAGAGGDGAEVDVKAPRVGTGASSWCSDASPPTPLPQRRFSDGCRIGERR